MWLYISTLTILWTLSRYHWICPAAHHHSRGDSQEINNLFSFISISQRICRTFHLFCRVYTRNPYCTHMINPYFPGLSSMQCADRIIVELSVKHARMIWVNLIIRRKQLNKSTEHKISITCINLSIYIYIWLTRNYWGTNHMSRIFIYVYLFGKNDVIMSFNRDKIYNMTSIWRIFFIW